MLKAIALILFATSLLGSCGSKGKTNTPVETELLRLNNLYDSALMHHDATTLKRLYADEFVYTNPEGKLLTKEQQTTSIASSEINLAEGKSTDVIVKVYGKMAVMTGLFSGKGTYRGNPLTVNERYTTVWIKTDTSWQMVVEQGNVVK
jgi:ketosteroid isomerase-like protein